LFSRFYAWVSPQMEDQRMAELRDELLAPLSGTVVEVGAGNGPNFAHYPSAMTHVVAVEPEPKLRALAEKAALQAPVPVTVTTGTADRLPPPDHSIDHSVLCLVLCSITDRSAALKELRRVLRPDGQLRFLEHTFADTAGLRLVQRIADATIWPILTGGCHTATDPVTTIKSAGFDIGNLRRLRFPHGRLVTPASPHVLGTATRIFIRSSAVRSRLSLRSTSTMSTSSCNWASAKSSGRRGDPTCSSPSRP
jgi:ubiquinone/menaquinone biosynthesis C-methylase UbiE